MRTAYLPLRSSVELFQDPTSPAPVTRAKIAAILFDAVIFEVGLHEATIGKTASFSMTFEATPERRERARVVHEIGTPFTIGFGVQEGPGIPAKPEDMHVVAHTPLTVVYAAEWHTSVIDDLEALDVVPRFFPNAADGWPVADPAVVPGRVVVHEPDRQRLRSSGA